MQIRQKRNLQLLLATLAVTVGGTIYILWRPDTLMMFRWLTLVGVAKPVAVARRAVPLPALAPDWMVFSLPEGLWAFAWVLLMRTIWQQGAAVAWSLIIPLVALACEWAQATGILPGTFAAEDCILIVAGLLGGLVLSGGENEYDCPHKNSLVVASAYCIRSAWGWKS